MKVVYTPAALADLAEIADWLRFIIRCSLQRSSTESASSLNELGIGPRVARVEQASRGAQVIPVGRYPYKIFYRVTADAVEIFHIHHSARQPWDEQE